MPKFNYFKLTIGEFCRPRAAFWRNMKYDLTFKEKFFSALLVQQKYWAEDAYLHFSYRLYISQVCFFEPLPIELFEGSFREMTLAYQIRELPVFENAGLLALNKENFTVPMKYRFRIPLSYLDIPNLALTYSIPSIEEFLDWKQQEDKQLTNSNEL